MASITISGGHKWKAYLQRLAQKAKVRAGVPEGATNSEGKSVAEYAAYNEFGAARIPPRPFMRNTLEEQRRNWIDALAALLKEGHTPDNALQLLGRRMADDIQAKILSNMDPANAASTIAGKNKKEAGRAGTLVDTGALVTSISYVVEK